MKLYLAHHGDAIPKEQDPERPLTPQGRSDLTRMAAFLQQAGITVTRVLHSDKIRAVETARILATTVAPGVTLEQRAGIRPDDPVDPLLAEISSWETDTLVAGHGPHFSRLVAQLLTGEPEVTLIATRPGTVICLERSNGGGFQLAWMVRPELLGS